MSGKTDNNMKIPEIKLHLWLEGKSGVYFGQGRYELLYLINGNYSAIEHEKFRYICLPVMI